MKVTRECVKHAKRIVVKVGTSTLTYNNGKINFSRIDKLARVISDLMNQERNSFGYIRCDWSWGSGAKAEKTKISKRKAGYCFAVGQSELCRFTADFSDYSQVVAQILLLVM